MPAPHRRAIPLRRRRHVGPDRRHQHLLSRRHAEGAAQIGGVLRQGAEDGGEVPHQPLLPPPGDPVGGAGRDAANLVVVIREEVPDDQQPMGDTRAPDHPHQWGEGQDGRPGDEDVEPLQLQIPPRRLGCMSAREDELAGVAHQPPEAIQQSRRAAHHPHPVPDPGRVLHRLRLGVPVEMQRLHFVSGIAQGASQLGRQVGAAGLGRKLHAGQEKAHALSGLQASRQTWRRT